MDDLVKGRRKLTASVILLALLLVNGCQFQVDLVSKDTKELILNMHNSDVKWNDSLFVFVPEFNGPTRALHSIDEPIEPLLVEALLDEERYVAAHVLLTMRTERGPVSAEPENWNGLQMQLLPDGVITYEGNDLESLHQQWIEKLADQGK